ncbi:MAG: cell wall metabolism sensor histidine kinase WalK [Clostridia bacterium]|nr:cell wall metabolism sensor histidine kinase WalK [Clostridia bacterium]
MLGINMWKSIRWKIIFVYFLLVFIAMIIVGVFILQQLEAYHLDTVKQNLERLYTNHISESIRKYDDIVASKNEIQSDADTWTKGIEEEVFVIDDYFNIIASSSSLINRDAIDVLDADLITAGFNGIETSKHITEQDKPTMNMVYPIKEDNRVKGIVYLRSDLSSIYDAMERSKLIFIKAIVLALFITVILGFFIARSITVPINDVTEKAERMAKGDFSQIVSVKSDDEIGRLAEMFNFLRIKLDSTLLQINNEKSKLETILKYMADGLIAVGTNGNIIHANPAAIQMLKISDYDISCKTYDEIIKRYSEKLTLEYIKNNMEVWEGRENFEYGKSVFLARYAPFKDENANNIGIVMVIQDITKRQKFENMQREFVANVSHELKTPLTSIKSYTETLLDGAIEDKEMAIQFLMVVDSESDRMGRLVKDLLQLSRLDYKREKWNKSNNNLLDIVKTAVLKIQINVKNKNQYLNKLYKESEYIPVYVDKDRIDQVILNILSNAIKYTQEGGRIDIDTVRKENEAHIVIGDNGIGIPEEDIPRLFERFYRVDKARSRVLGGTGLGLSIAKQIIQEHGGDITIESQEGNGTTATITLPIVDNDIDNSDNL